MNVREISRRLSDQAETVATYLLPNGTREGNYWRTGSVGDDKGRSLKVLLHGEKAGRWMDHAEDAFHGDLIDLWMHTRGLPLAKAIEEAKSYLGIREPSKPAPARVRPFVEAKPKPGTRAAAEGTEVHRYLVEERGLNPEALRLCRISELDGAIVLPYLKNGKRMMIKYLSLDRSKGKKVWTSANPTKCLFGWDALDANARRVVITEGEIDAMTLIGAGIPALSIPYGAGQQGQSEWIENDYDELERFDEILIWMDDDDAGRQTAQEIAKRLGIERCSIITTPGGHNDVNELWLAGKSLNALNAAIDSAEPVSPETLRPASGFLQEVTDVFYPQGGEEPGFDLAWESFRDVRFRPAELIVLSGFNGHGKSELAGQILLEALEAGQRGCIASLEMPARRVLARLMRQAGGTSQPSKGYLAAINDWIDGKLWIYDHVGRADIEDLLASFTYAKKRYGVTVFLIDSLMMLGIANDDYDGQAQFVRRLMEWKLEHDTTVFLVAHSRKQQNEDARPGKMDVRGAGELTDMADTVLTVWRDKREDREADGMVMCVKQRNGEAEPTQWVWFNEDSHQFRPSPKMKSFQHVQYSQLKAAG